jgi:phage tail-like protein
MWNWFQGAMEGRIKQTNLAILLMNPDGSTACRWEVQNALPVKWGGSNLSGKSGDIFLETLTLVHQGFKKV